MARQRAERFAVEEAARQGLGQSAAGAAVALSQSQQLGSGLGTLSPRRAGPSDTLSDSNQQEVPTSTKGIVLAQGCGCLNQHWMCCFGVAILMLVISLFLLLLHANLVGSSESTPQQGNTASGVWYFVYVVMIIGFTISGLAFVICAWSWLSNPEQRTCAAPDQCCAEIECPSCALPSVDSCCPSGAADAPSCSCGSCGGGGESNCALPDCADCKCELCGPPAAGPGLCEQICAALPPCEMPSFSCDCCPNCDGVSSACSTCCKILTCQCKIQV